MTREQMILIKNQIDDLLSQGEKIETLRVQTKYGRAEYHFTKYNAVIFDHENKLLKVSPAEHSILTYCLFDYSTIGVISWDLLPKNI